MKRQAEGEKQSRYYIKDKTIQIANLDEKAI